MKKLALFVLIGLFISKPAQAIEDDKIFHFGISFVVTSIAFGIISQDTCTDNADGVTMRCGRPLPLATRLLVAGIVGLAVGIAKETLDSQPGGTGFDMADMAANAAGVGTALVVWSW